MHFLHFLGTDMLRGSGESVGLGQLVYFHRYSNYILCFRLFYFILLYFFLS